MNYMDYILYALNSPWIEVHTYSLSVLEGYGIDNFKSLDTSKNMWKLKGVDQC